MATGCVWLVSRKRAFIQQSYGRQKCPPRCPFLNDPAIQITRNYQSVREFYENDQVWSKVDRWHRFTQREVAAALGRAVKTVGFLPDVIANLGSGGNTFGLNARLHIHVDLVHARLLGQAGVVANVEQLPLRDSSVDLAVCVGSVLNHGNGQTMIQEISRILRPRGVLVLEFDSADGLHQRTIDGTNSSVLVETFFNGHMLTLTEYSGDFIETELRKQGFQVQSRYSFHILSALMLRWLNPAVAATFFHFDGFARRLERLRYRGSNLLIIARKQ